MQDAILLLQETISSKSFPSDVEELFRDLWEVQEKQFHLQENAILDYKEEVPSTFSSGYGAGFVRLALAFYNSYGGVIVVGVRDSDLRVCGVGEKFDIEAFNRVLSDKSDHIIECHARSYDVVTPLGKKNIVVVIVPRRGVRSPARLTQGLDKYPIGTLWVRERHEVVSAAPRHYPMLYSTREHDLNSSSETIFPIHRSLPPSPATMKDFVARDNLMTNLWEWFVFGSQPRFYLHGPGGSGKSTLAFEFCRSIAESGGSIVTTGGDRIDYAIYLSAKETEFNTQSLKSQLFLARNFSSREQQFAQIAFHSGMTSVDFGSDLSINFLNIIEELFNGFCGLIIIDDIDALSRKGLDTGEEELFIKCITARRRTRILYTLRFPPSYALNSSQDVPGLDYGTEFIEFVTQCCKQFGVGVPSSEQLNLISDATGRLPLLVETLVGLKKHCGNFREAVALFESKGGDEARRYLYQREYDRLDSSGKSRQILALLSLLDESARFQTILNLLPFSKEQVTDALTESRSIFLSTLEEEDGEVLYQLTPPASKYIKNVSVNLSYFNRLSATVRHFKSEIINASPDEAAVIALYGRLIRQKEFEKIAEHFDNLATESVVAVNPRVTSLAAQAFSEMGPDKRERARNLFRQTYGLGHFDNHMLRRWFNMEFNSGYGLEEAERVCRIVVDRRGLGPRLMSEFWSKLGSCYLQRSVSVMSVSREKGIDNLVESIICYVEGFRIGRGTPDFEQRSNLEWMGRPLHRLLFHCKNDPSSFFIVFERMAERGRDLPEACSELVLEYMRRLPAPSMPPERRQLRAVCSRVMGKLARHQRGNAESGYGTVIIELEQLKQALSD